MSNTESGYGIFWTEAMNQLEDELSEQEFAMWFNRMQYVRTDDSRIVVAVPSSFYRDQVKQRYLPSIEQKLYELSGTKLAIEFEVRKNEAPPQPAPDRTRSATAGPTAASGSASSTSSGGRSGAGARAPGGTAEDDGPAPRKPKRPHENLNRDYTFESFVIGQNNSFAANAAMAISKNPGTAYNPCLVYGGVGLGKTHLLQAIGNTVYNEMDNVKVVYVTAESFTNEFIMAIREKKTHQFKAKYRYADVLLIDDIHFLQKKSETQEELFHTFNALYDANKQMVFTCDRPVSELRDLADRLRSRFERGLNVDLQPPSYETRYAILKKKIDAAGLAIPEEAVSLICNNVTTNVRDLEAALTKLVAYAELVNKDITIEITRQQLKDVFASPKQTNITIDTIQRTVADYFNLSNQELKSKKRTRVVAFPRQLAMHITREITEYSTTEIGLEFGGRDHTTVMHACQRIDARMRTDPTLEPTLQYLIRTIKDQSAQR
ncbi:MAG: chromosomal replication initiator protein DnaA [Spirochaetaceae bacterium]|nr:MAG: chromosomal replication initiator protein DnaA [Spirochaetaceae bacterium]